MRNLLILIAFGIIGTQSLYALPSQMGEVSKIEASVVQLEDGSIAEISELTDRGIHLVNSAGQEIVVEFDLNPVSHKKCLNRICVGDYVLFTKEMSHVKVVFLFRDGSAIVETATRRLATQTEFLKAQLRRRKGLSVGTYAFDTENQQRVKVINIYENGIVRAESPMRRYYQSSKKLSPEI